MEIYSYIPPLGTNIPISLEPFPVDDSVPTEDEIEWAVKRLRNHRSRGLSGMRSEYLKRWLAAARKVSKDKTTARAETTEYKETTAGMESTEPTEAANWEMVLNLVQTAFQEGRLAEEATWQTVVLISKGKKDYRGIGLVEMMWKVVAEILNIRLTSSITFHNFLHGFWVGRGTGTVTIEAKLLRQLAAFKEEVLYVIFLDLHKAHDALGRSRCLEILDGYSVVPRDKRILQTDWRRITMVTRAGGLLRNIIPGRARGESGRSALLHHL